MVYINDVKIIIWKSEEISISYLSTAKKNVIRSTLKQYAFFLSSLEEETITCLFVSDTGLKIALMELWKSGKIILTVLALSMGGV